MKKAAEDTKADADAFKVAIAEAEGQSKAQREATEAAAAAIQERVEQMLKDSLQRADGAESELADLRGRLAEQRDEAAAQVASMSTSLAKRLEETHTTHLSLVEEVKEQSKIAARAHRQVHRQSAVACDV